MLETGPSQRLHENSGGIVDEEVILGDQLVTLLKEDTEAAEAAIMHEGIAAKLDMVRVHDGSAGYVVSEEVVFKDVAV